MIYQDHTVLGFHFDTANPGMIRVHLRPRLSFDNPSPDSFICDFLTGENAIEIQSPMHRPAVPMVLLSESRHLNTLMHYTNILTMISDLAVAHGHNTEVFGPAAGQELIIDFSKTYRVALRIENTRMLSALSTAVAGVEVNGEMMKTGTVLSFDRFLSYALEQAEVAIKSLDETRQSVARLQWEQASRAAIERCKRHFIGGTSSEAEVLNLVQACEYLKVSKTTLSRYRDGHVPKGYSPFPQPDDYHGRSPLWKLISLLVWKNSRMS